MATKKTSKTAAKKTAKKSTKSGKDTKQSKITKKIEEATVGMEATPIKDEMVVSEEKFEKREESASSLKQSIKIRKSHVILIIIIILVGVFLYFSRGLFVAAVVNGQPISRISVVQQAEKQSGKQSLETLVRNSLIEQEAQKQKITVSEKEIDDETKKVEEQLAKQGQKIDDVLKMQGMTKKDLRELIRLDKLVGKIVGKDIKVTDEEVDKYVEENKEMLPKDQDEKKLKESVKEQLHQQKLNEKVRSWLEDIERKANIMYFVQY